MGNWKYAILNGLIMLGMSFSLQAVTKCELEKSLSRKGYNEQEIDERLTAYDVKQRMKQAQGGLQHQGKNTQWYDNPIYPVPYVFYREGQVDFGFNRW